MNEDQLDVSREEFELYMRKQRPCMSLEKTEFGYTDKDVERLWQTWIAVNL